MKGNEIIKGIARMLRNSVTASGRASRLGRVLAALALASCLRSGLSFATAGPPTSGPASETTAEGIGLQAASALASVFYLPFKGVMALTGGLAGGIAYLFSAGNLEVAEAVWAPSVYGTYLLTPDHLTGRKPIQFFGTSSGSNASP